MLTKQQIPSPPSERPPSWRVGPDPLVVTEQTDDYLIAELDRVMVVGWLKDTTHAGVLAASKQWFGAKRRAGMFGVLVVIGPNASSPPPEQRQALARLMKHGEGKVACSAIIFEGTGFRASFVRSIATGLVLLARPGFPNRVIAKDSAADYFAHHFAQAKQPFDRERFEAGLDAVLGLLGTNEHPA